MRLVSVSKGGLFSEVVNGLCQHSKIMKYKKKLMKDAYELISVDVIAEVENFG